MKIQRIQRNAYRIALAAAAMAALSASALAATTPGQGKATVTVMSKQEGGVPPTVAENDLQLRIDGRPATITSWNAATGPLQVVLLIDNGARTSLGRQLSDMNQFITELPEGTQIGIAYMQNGQAEFAGPLTADKQTALRSLRLPAGTPGSSASPYFCLSDLAKHWPSSDMSARREVVMITNGVDNYEPRYDPNDPYVQAAIQDSLKAGLVVNSIYWTDSGWFNRTGYAANTGQNLLIQVSQATGGKTYWQGFGNPVSFTPYFKDLTKRFGAQYELAFSAPLRGRPQTVDMRLKVHVAGAKVEAPSQVWLSSESAEQPQ